MPTLPRKFWPMLLAAAAAWAPAARAEPGDDTVVQAREALRKKDRAALASARMAVNSAHHPLAMWVEYWELQNRLQEAQQSELDTFYARWPGSYVEDRLRNDWLLELGRRRDWVNFGIEYPRFRMNDDREVSCYALLVQHLGGQDVRAAARAAWFAQREQDDGCTLLAGTMIDAKQLTPDDAWQATRLAVEFNRPRLARAAAALVHPRVGEAVALLLDAPQRALARPGAGSGANGQDLLLLTLMRMAASDPDYTAGQLASPIGHRLPSNLEATAWAHVAKQAALKQLPLAGDYARRAWKLWDVANRRGTQPPWSEDLLAWHVRAALREPAKASARWTLVARAIDAMPPTQQADATWVYWKARAAQARAPAGEAGEPVRSAARAALESIAAQMNFYGKLATEDLGGRITLPPAPAPLLATERDAPRSHPGLARALQLIDIGLRPEGVREWNFALRGMPERELLAAAQWACEREVWDRCINTSDRTRSEVDIRQRFPMPLREQVVAAARDAGLDAAVLYGLIRQESRFIADARSTVGAKGLMQLMPGTARWTAKKIGVAYRPEMATEPQLNLQLGAAYLKRLVDEFGGSLALAAAGYNAGPGRPRKWREGGAVMEPAAWAETIPFNETRDYVKKVLSNSVDYAALLGAPMPTLKSRLGPPIGPRDPASPAPDRDLP